MKSEMPQQLRRDPVHKLSVDYFCSFILFSLDASKNMAPMFHIYIGPLGLVIRGTCDYCSDSLIAGQNV